MSDTHDWRCRVGRHHHVPMPDDNPEKRGAMRLECTRCGHIKDGIERDSTSMRGATGMGAGF